MYIFIIHLTLFELNLFIKKFQTDKNGSISSFKIYSAISRGDDKVRLVIKGSWNKENGLRLKDQDQIATPVIETFYGRKLIMSIQHVR